MSLMLNAGEDPGYIAQQVGHADISVTLKYYARFIKNTGVNTGLNWRQLMKLLRLLRLFSKSS